MRSRFYTALVGVRTGPAASFARGVAFILVVLLFSIFGYILAPFSSGDKRVMVPPGRASDAVQATLLIGSGMEKLLTEPLSYYDTAILYPDRNQLRGTEPFLGFVLLGLPLKTILRLSDSDVFEVLRWAIVFTCLTYAYLLFRTIGLDVALSVAGAVLCVSQPDLLNGIDRLQIVSIPLILPILYHGMMAWSSGRSRHSVGLFVFAALYPLCGIINAMLWVVALLLVLPLLLKMLVGVQPRTRLATGLLLPLLLAAVLDAVIMGPWLLDRSDMTGYVSDAYLQIRNWNARQAPGGVDDIPGFVMVRFGPGVVIALVMLYVSIAVRRVGRAVKDAVHQPEATPPTQRYLSVMCVVALGLVMSTAYPYGRLIFPWSRLLFQVVCWVALLMFWRRQMRFFVSSDQNGLRNAVVMLSAGVGVFLCLMSFGPVYVSNDSPLANPIVTMLMNVVPPLKALREFRRIWPLGVLFVSVYAAARLGADLRLRAPIVRACAAAVIVVATAFSVYNRRPLVASPRIEAPRNLFDLASHSRGAGGIYVHPHLRSNSFLGVWMIPTARVLGRPIVNGSLGIPPPWVKYAGRVLYRFPDPESLWLLRRWKVDTVVSLGSNVQRAESEFVEKSFENGNGVVYEIAAPPEEVPHPSDDRCAASEARVPVEVENRAQRVDDGASLTLTVPAGFRVRRVEFAFGRPVVEKIPESIEIYALEGTRRVRLNEHRSGDWLESLAADAFVRHESAVATIKLTGPQPRELHVEFRTSNTTPIERIGLCGEWTR
jgi:hypothetical protein